MSNLINFAKTREEREMRQLAEKLSNLAVKILNVITDDGLSIAELQIFVNKTLPMLVSAGVDGLIKKHSISDLQEELKQSK